MGMKFPIWILLFCILGPHLMGAVANDWNLDLTRAEGHVEFLAMAMPEMQRIRGSAPVKMAQPFRGKLSGHRDGDQWLVSGTATLDLTVLDTGLPMRDRLMKEKYLETQKFATAELTLAEAKFPTEGSPKKFKAQLKLHGESKGIEGDGKIETKDGLIAIALEFQANLDDFAIARPVMMTVTVEPEISVTVAAEGRGD
jgi:polyisoprenoid-binding protein YceI